MAYNGGVRHVRRLFTTFIAVGLTAAAIPQQAFRSTVVVQVAIYDLTNFNPSLSGSEITATGTRVTFKGLDTVELLPALEKAVKAGSAKKLFNPAVSCLSDHKAMVKISGAPSYTVDLTPTKEATGTSLRYKLTVESQPDTAWSDTQVLSLARAGSAGVLYKKAMFADGPHRLLIIFQTSAWTQQ
jgi:hypothetical protein